MVIMNEMNKLSQFDLNLLLVFRVMDEVQHVTKASQILGMTQPAISHALRRLREFFNDPLFVRSSEGMVLTPLAQKLRDPIRAIVGDLQSKVLLQEDFSPKTLNRTFRIRTTDLVEGILIPKLMGLLEEKAPQSRLSILRTGTELPKRELETGHCDLAIAGFYGELTEGFYQQKLLLDHYVSCVSKEHPRIKSGKVSVEDFCEEKHILISPGGDLTGPIDKLLSKQKKARRVVVGASSFMVAGWILLETECVLTAPSRLISQFQKYLPIRAFTTPVKSDEIKIVQVWHERNQEDPAHQWFRSLVFSCLQ